MAKLSYLSASETRALLCKYFDKVCATTVFSSVLTCFSVAKMSLQGENYELTIRILMRTDMNVSCRWCLCVRRSVNYNLPWLS